MTKGEIDKRERIDAIMNSSGATFIRFKGAAYMNIPKVTRGLKPFRFDDVARFMEGIYPGMTNNKKKDFAETIATIAPDWSEYDRYVGFYDQVWDMQRLEFVTDQFKFVYQTRIKLQPAGSPGYIAARKFVEQLAAGDAHLATDYLQAMAPIFMKIRPNGVIWFIGNGANGKSALLKALYLGFGDYFSSMTTAAIEDGRDIPMLRGKLGNIVRESSEARVEDTERYKSLGTHEPITVHEFNKQGGLTVETDFHTIFNANNIPIFSDKTRGARRRTLPVPFPAHFQDNPTFEEDTFTDEFLGGLFSLILEQTVAIRDNRSQYNWSPATVALKESYDSEVNSAEAFVEHLKDTKVVGFFNFGILKGNYEEWCRREGMNALGGTTLKRAIMNDVGAIKKVMRVEGRIVSRFLFEKAPIEVTWLDNGYAMPVPKKEVTINQVKQGEMPW